VVVDLRDDDALRDGLPRRDGPAGALDGVCGLEEVGPERVDAAEVTFDLLEQFALRRVVLGPEVLPEDRVQDMAREVEGEVLLELGDGGEVGGRTGRGELLQVQLSKVATCHASR
jgi:hypothetical protein